MKALNTNKLDIFKDIVFLFLVRVKISVTLKMPIALQCADNSSFPGSREAF